MKAVARLFAATAVLCAVGAFAIGSQGSTEPGDGTSMKKCEWGPIYISDPWDDSHAVGYGVTYRF